MKNKRSKGWAAGLALIIGASMFSSPVWADEDTQVRDVPTFDRIVIEGAMDVSVNVGKKQRVEVTAESRYIDRVETRVDGKTLYLSQEGRRWRDVDVEVEISVQDLEAFIVEGAADAEITGIHSDHFKLEIDGAGDVTLGGTCGSADYEINGAGDVDAEELKCKSVEIVINGAGDADVYASEEVRAELNGVGDITVCGDPDRVRPSINGLGSFDVGDC